MANNRNEVIQDILVLLGLVLIIAIILWVHWSSLILTVGHLSMTKSRLLTIGITIGATGFTNLVGSQIQYGLMRSLEDRLRSIAEQPHLLQDTSALNDDDEYDDHHREDMRTIERDWRSILKIDSLTEKFKNYQIFLLYVFCGLITTSIVTTLSPNLVTKHVPYNAIIPDTEFGIFTNGDNRSCFGISNSSENFGYVYGWRFSNGSALLAAYDGECPASDMIQQVAGINTRDSEDHVYVQSGVAVDRSALGASVSIFSGSAFTDISNYYKQSLVSTTQCVPVLTSNPVKCRKSGSVSVFSENQLKIKTGNIVLPNRTYLVEGYTSIGTLNRNLTVDSGMVNQGWSISTDDENDFIIEQSVGLAVIGFGASNDPKGVVPFASHLAELVSDPDKEAGKAGNSTYAVTCIVDPRHSFDYRLVTLGLKALGQGNGSNYAQYLSGKESCKPSNPTISNKLFSIAGSAHYQLYSENSGKHGYIETLTRISNFNRTRAYAFDNSANSLEDLLGIASALAVSKISLENRGVRATSIDDQKGEYNAVVEATRLGTDSNESLWLLIPPIGSLLILLTLFFLGIRRKWAAGGTDFPGPHSERPKLYAAESIYQLVSLGFVTAHVEKSGIDSYPSVETLRSSQETNS